MLVKGHVWWGCAWQRVYMAGGYAWQGAYMAGVGACMVWTCMAGGMDDERACIAGGACMAGGHAWQERRPLK